MKNSRSVALEVVVDVDSDAGVGGLVCTRKRNLGWASTATARDLDLGTANVLIGWRF